MHKRRTKRESEGGKRIEIEIVKRFIKRGRKLIRDREKQKRWR